MNLVSASSDRLPLPAALPDEPGLTEIGPPRGWQLVNVAELWDFRDLVYFLAWRDVKIRYKQTALGAAWAVLQPALMMVVFTLFFARLAQVSSSGLAYPLFAYAGLLPWTFFATALAGAGNSVVGSERLITKIYFPRLAIPFAAVGAAIVDLLVACGLLVVLMAYYQVWGGWQVLLVPGLVLLMVLAAAGAGTLLAALNVHYRDFRYVIPFLVQVWMFATPSIYLDIFDPSQLEPTGWVRALLIGNPMTGLVAAFRAALLGTPMPWDLLGYAAALSIGLFLLGCFYFRRMEDSFADVI
jgi:lipopolysaccharide transport system permease protein